MSTRFGAAGHGLDSSSYTDLNRLNEMKVGKDRDSEQNTRKVAQEFESLFLNEMLKSMRSATEVLAKDNPFNSPTAKHYQDMHDQQLSVSLSRNGGGIGIADVLVRQLNQQAQTSGRSNPFAQTDAQSTAAAAQPEAQSPRSVATGLSSGEQRDDSRLLNQRRLALPGKLSERIAANVSATATASGAAADTGVQTTLSGERWESATAFAAPQDKPLVTGPSKTRFDSPEEFIATMLPMAEQAAGRLGVDARYLVAQAALETGWGKSMIRQKDGSNSHNLFGIKSTGWQGESAQVTTTEYVNGAPVKERAGFRAYSSFEQSFNDYVALLQNNDRYRNAVAVADRTGDSEGFMRELQRAGYATDPNYAKKVNQIARRVQTYQTIAAADVSQTLRSKG
ncbi:flagellar assembly peptidoglycan hydrolase FlgJ [Stutzerimonas kirkiae]|uniref:Peptidoglycan hydrolase FlgJ n=1 Tax=Stutzerimonas kirkiae TaxID=2211392 RepID=A0A4Q9RAI7_9GAMM|nr:flagellar assembly peptidoglycan hydrolase FlgJ [Stutzerimonas kirkiae]TBU96816.1 flagellar assembly peptidoglycan hydrolase FlgJ [Stutzerimonas kirkiae]TBV01055.1 flagellar assembly peptidoglycan hydrolase FlgJ [Stutzerimonas kirkiae]TBV08403.1 flagellar assembly peptidoglycan hydrolase FlgJ [Stutzerimonas kirkiae]